MAKRKTLSHPDHVRQKIRATQLINRLMALIDGKITLSISQVRAIDILLKKVVPDLAHTPISPARFSIATWSNSFGSL
jgi:hypothetical protein